MKRLPLGMSNFQQIIEGDYLYIDKTKHIYDILQQSRYLFLSRPRRFGKSLLISTLKELFLGNKELFNNTWIGQNSNHNWKKHPVIHLDFSTLSFETSQEFKISLNHSLDWIAQAYNVNISKENLIALKIRSLLLELSKQNPVVVLIDEYDAALLKNIHKENIANNIRDVMSEFFNTLKGSQEYLQAIFLTGVTKFSKASIFSGFNNLLDLTLSTKASTLLGYTEKELRSYFYDYAQEFALKNSISEEEVFTKLKEWYNGYRFSSENIKVYNPFSVLSCFTEDKIENYWLETGTPSFLVKLIQQEGYEPIKNIDEIEFKRESLGAFEIGQIPLIPILFQAGYLTISGYDKEENRYKLDYPNKETELSFKNYILAGLAHITAQDADAVGYKIKNTLKNNDIERFVINLQSLIANIPYNLHEEKESYYHSLLHVLMDSIGLGNQSEVSTSIGRIDMTVDMPGQIYIFEFKFKKSAQEALEQIEQQRYYEKYLHLNKPITLVGISFQTNNKKIALEWTKKNLKAN